MTEYMKRLAKHLENKCPENDCRIYLNLYRLYREYEDDLKSCILGINTQHIIRREMARLVALMCDMYLSNYAVRTYRRDEML